MTDRIDEQIVDNILDAFIQELAQGRSPDLNQFLVECPDELKGQLRRRLRAAELVFRYHYTSRVSSATVEKTRERIKFTLKDFGQ